MDEKMLARIKGDPNYQALVKERSSFGWTLAIICWSSTTATSPSSPSRPR